LGGLNIFSVISVNQHLASVLPGLGDFPADRVRETDAIGLELARQLAGLPKAEIGLRQASRGVCATLRVQ
jgi:hypothetical protein